MSEIISTEDRFVRILGMIVRMRTSLDTGSPPALLVSNLFDLATELEAIRGEYEQSLSQTQNNIELIQELREKVNKLTRQPLMHALLIGPSLRNGDYIISHNGQRMEVGLVSADEGQYDPATLLPGTEVLINRENYAIVGVRGPGNRGEVAEVVDIIQDEPDSPERLLVRCGGSEGTIVEIAAPLLTLDRSSEADGNIETVKVQLKPGDTVLVDLAAKIALQKMPPNEASALKLEHDPKDCYEDIAGLEDKIEIIKDAIELPFLYRQQYRKYNLQRPRGILLYGPPGCGKTMIGRAVANGLKKRIEEHLEFLIDQVKLLQSLKQQEPDETTHAKLAAVCPSAAEKDLTQAERVERLQDWLAEELAPTRLKLNLDDPAKALKKLEREKREVSSYFLNIKGPELLSKWVGEAESRIRQLFAEAKRKASYTKPVVAFFDEIESMFQRRGSGISSDLEKTTVPQLLTELDGVEELEDVVVIGASNRHELLDPALTRPGRLDIKIRIDRPDKAAATAIFKLYLQSSLPIASDLLLGEYRSNFHSELKKVLERFSVSNAYLFIRNGKTDSLLAPLSRLMNKELTEGIIDQICKNALAVVEEGKGIRYADVTRAIEQTVFARRAQLAEANHLTKEFDEVKLVMSLGAAEQAIADFHLATSPLIYPALSGVPPLSHPSIQERREQLADILISLSVDTIFSPNSYIKANILAACGRQYSYPLREFISGALIRNIVDRAKRMALKRETATSLKAAEGITPTDLMLAIRNEYEENKEQFIANKPEISEGSCDVCKRRHNSAEEYDLSVVLGRGRRDVWHIERKRAYARGRTAGQVTLLPSD